MLLLSIFNGQLSRCHIDKQMTNNYHKKKSHCWGMLCLGYIFVNASIHDDVNDDWPSATQQESKNARTTKCQNDKRWSHQNRQFVTFVLFYYFFASTQNPSVDCSLNYARSLEIKITIIRNKLVSWTSTKHETRNVMVIRKNWHLKMVAVINLNSLVSHFLQTAIKTT